MFQTTNQLLMFINGNVTVVIMVILMAIHVNVNDG